MKIKYFYNLKFFKADNEAVFDLGVFSCLKNAKKKQNQVATKCGFVDNPKNFRINRIGVKFEDNAEVEKSKTVLYCVWLEYSQSEDNNIVDYFRNFGYYSTNEEALKVVEYNKKNSRVGKKHPEGFLVDKVLVDNYSEWSEGFVSY